MAYSMFECPKLQNAKSLKFYPEEYDHHISFRHKNLPSDFDLTMENYNNRARHIPEVQTNFSLEAQTSKHSKCPIYVHNFSRIHHTGGDFVPKNKKKVKHNQRLAMNTLEESYWANWKPEKNDMKKSTSPIVNVAVKSSKSPEIHVIKSAPPRRRKIKLYPDLQESVQTMESQVEVEQIMKKIGSKSQEIQTDESSLIPKIEESVVVKEEESVVIKKEEEEECVPVAEVIPSEDVVSEKFLKHTDSFILNVKKQTEEKEPIDQPKCIRLYKRPVKISSKNFVRGGSYPLKSCLKNESTVSKTSSKLARPGSPIIVSSSFSTKGKKPHKH